MKENDKEKLKYGLFLIPLGLIVFFVLIIPIISVITGSLKDILLCQRTDGESDCGC